MENWNFHGYVALQLENYVKKYVGETYRTAYEIENGEFVDVMITVLKVRYGFDNSDLDEFKSMCNEYYDLPASQIPDEVAKELFEEFERLIKIREE